MRQPAGNCVANLSRGRKWQSAVVLGLARNGTVMLFARARQPRRRCYMIGWRQCGDWLHSDGVATKSHWCGKRPQQIYIIIYFVSIHDLQMNIFNFFTWYGKRSIYWSRFFSKAISGCAVSAATRFWTTVAELLPSVALTVNCQLCHTKNLDH